MCRRWASGPWLAVNVGGIEYDKRDTLATIQSSKWAERGFCNQCGTGLFFRMTAEGKYHGVTSVSLGTLDDQSGITLNKEWFFDKKPDCYALAGERDRITEAQAFAMFSGG
jgi:hypothetical protein